MVHANGAGNNSKSAGKVKPAKRLELAFWPTQHGTATPWAGMRFDGGKGAEVVTPKFADPLDAASELLDLAARTGLPVYVGHLADELIARFRMEGIDMYRHHIGREACRNRYVRQGWEAAYLDDMQPAIFKA